MIVNAFKNKLFPFYSGKSPLEQITELDKLYGRDLINKYFFENSLIRIMKKLKDYKKILKNFRCITP